MPLLNDPTRIDSEFRQMKIYRGFLKAIFIMHGYTQRPDWIYRKLETIKPAFMCNTRNCIYAVSIQNVALLNTMRL